MHRIFARIIRDNFLGKHLVQEEDRWGNLLEIENVTEERKNVEVSVRPKRS